MGKFHIPGWTWVKVGRPNCNPVLKPLKLSFLSKRLFAPLYASLAVLIFLLLAQEGLSLVVSILKQQTVDSINQTFQIKRESERLLRAALEEKVALRGYLLDPNDEFLEQYQAGQDTFSSSLERLSQLLGNNPRQQENLTVIKAFHSEWESQFAQPVIQGSFEIETLSEQGSLDTLRETVNRILEYEQSLLDAQNSRLARLEGLNQLSFSLSGLSIGIIIVGSGLNFALLRRRVISPTQQLIKVGHAWKTGQLTVQIDHVSEDEVGRLAETLNGMASDIRLRQEKIQQRNQQLEDLISTLSHDLRTPLLANRSTLSAILGGAFGPVNDALKTLLTEYREANDNLIKLVETLLDISRYEAGGSQILNREPLDWDKLCNRVIAWIHSSSQHKCSLHLCIKPGLAKVYGDPIEIQRVLQNLVDNAVRLSEPGKRVLIEVIPADSGHIQVGVHDQGPGLAEQEANRLFYRFSQGTGRHGRVGLGLYLCRQIIEAHGGRIWVESSLGLGATFWFMLPTELCTISDKAPITASS